MITYIFRIKEGHTPLQDSDYTTITDNHSPLQRHEGND